MLRRFSNFKNRKPVFFMVLGYVLLWVICCAFHTELIGKRKFEDYNDEYTKKVEARIHSTLGDLQQKMLSPDFNLSDEKTYVEFSYYKLLAELSNFTEGKVFAEGKLVAYDTNGINSYQVIPDENVKLSFTADAQDKVFYHAVKKSGGWEYYYCPMKYFEKIIKETYAIKGRSGNRWNPLNLTFVECWDISLIEAYVKGDEFRPVKVKAYYTGYNEGPGGTFIDSDEKIIDCSDIEIPEGFEPMNLSDYEQEEFYCPNITIPGDERSWNNISFAEMFSLGSQKYNEEFLDIFEFYSDRIDQNIPFSTYYLESTCQEYRLGGAKYKELSDYSYSNKRGTTGIPIPFTFLNGDVLLAMKTNLSASNGERINMYFVCYIEDCLKEYRSEFFKSMMLIYIGMFVFFAILVIYGYKRFYSLQGKNRFHKSLINSMAHDLKSPLMVVQGFSENLKENVHTEKREYYAEQILENITYLNSLIDKNLDFSKKKDFDSAGEDTVYLSGILNNTLMRYRKKLDEKKLTVTRIGDTSMKGDPDILGLVTDNLINNAIKYTMENEQIEVIGKYRYFIIRNKAELNYSKNLQNLLAPLEMADDSRTAGKGTGLGLSIANGIIQERGGKIKLSYDKKTKMFTCKVIVRKFL
ncbi:MAG: HAMP domain-containing histidine kinase [Lachnospiraceae bacterium]|nr:HAMP domain-containing histidine kinase [Lachnospiraceae bacterium]